MAYISSEGVSATTTEISSTFSITVPETCKTVVVLVSCYDASTNNFSGGTLTIDGVSMTAVPADGDTSQTWFQGAMFYLSNPSTANAPQTLVCTWPNVPDEKPGLLLAYYTDEISGVRDSDVDHHGSGTPPSVFTTPSISAQSGDLIVAGAWAFDSDNTGSENASFTMTNVTERAEYYGGAVVDMVIGDAYATGAQTVSASHGEGQEGGIIGVAFIPAASDSTAPVLTSATGTATGTTTATVGATTDEGNGTLYAVITTSNTQPSVAQIKAGQTNTGSTAPWSGSTAVSSTGAKTINATGLTTSTTYYAHLVHTDAASNDSNRITSSSFNTNTRKLKLLAHSSAAGATSIAGVVFNAPSVGAITGTKIGEFTGGAFLDSDHLESGQAVLKVAVADFGGSSLTTSDTPVALVRNATNTTGIIPTTIIEE